MIDKNQGTYVEFPPEIDNVKRIAFGHNGVGRHGIFCFNEQSYTVEMWKKRYVILSLLQNLRKINLYSN